MTIKRTDYPETDEELQARLLEAIELQSLPRLDYFGIDHHEFRQIEAEAWELSRATLMDYGAAFKHVALDHVERLAKPNE
jgi:hypothetical protein